jgi:hypothetical protein
MPSRALALCFAVVPGLALACPVCGQGKEGSGPALLVMSIIMTMLPLAMIGGVVGWVYLRVRRADREASLISALPKLDQ